MNGATEVLGKKRKNKNLLGATKVVGGTVREPLAKATAETRTYELDAYDFDELSNKEAAAPDLILHNMALAAKSVAVRVVHAARAKRENSELMPDKAHFLNAFMIFVDTVDLKPLHVQPCNIAPDAVCTERCPDSIVNLVSIWNMLGYSAGTLG